MTKRELQVYALLATGASNKEIARKLGISEGTVKIHSSNVFRRLNVLNRTQAAVAYARGVSA